MLKSSFRKGCAQMGKVVPGHSEPVMQMRVLKEHTSNHFNYKLNEGHLTVNRSATVIFIMTETVHNLIIILVFGIRCLPYDG